MSILTEYKAFTVTAALIGTNGVIAMLVTVMCEILTAFIYFCRNITKHVCNDRTLRSYVSLGHINSVYVFILYNYTDA